MDHSPRLVLKTAHTLVILVLLAVNIAAATSAKAESEQAPEAAMPLSPNMLREPVLDDSVVTTVEEERARHARSSASAASPALQVDGVPVLTAAQPLVIHASAFVEDGFMPGSHFFNFSGGYVEGTDVNLGCGMAPVDLPSGVTLRDMYALVYDNSSTANTDVTLRRASNFDGGAATTMAYVSTIGSATFVQDLRDETITDPTVVYPDYSYYVTTCLEDANNRLYSVRLYWD